MKDLINILNKVIDERFIIIKANDEIIISEDKNTKGCKKITLNLKQKKVFSYTLDKERDKNTNFRTFQFFNPTTASISKINDGNIVIVNNNKIVLLLIELKSERFTLNDVLLKIENSKFFFNYLIEIINKSYNKNYKINDIEYKGILFTSKTTTKGTTTGGKKIKFEIRNNMPFKILSCNRIYILDSFL